MADNIIPFPVEARKAAVEAEKNFCFTPENGAFFIDFDIDSIEDFIFLNFNGLMGNEESQEESRAKWNELCQQFDQIGQLVFEEKLDLDNAIVALKTLIKELTNE